MSSSESSEFVEPLRKRPRGLASTSAPTESTPATVHTETAAPHFPDPHRAMLSTLTTFDTPDHSSAFERLRGKAIADSLYIDDATLHHFHLYEEVQRLLAVGHISRLFDIRDPAFYPTTMEFLSTLHVGLSASDLAGTMPTHISFRAGGLSYRLTMAEFCIAMGLYTTDEIEAPEYDALCFAVHSFHYIDLWRDYSYDTTPYSPGRSKAATLRSYSLRYLHRVMVHSFLEGGRTTGVVGYAEFFILHCMSASIPMHLGHCLIRFLQSQSLRRQTGPTIGGGPYVTRLLRGLHMLHTVPRYLRPEGSWSPLDIPAFTGSLVRQQRDREFLSSLPVAAAAPPPTQSTSAPRPASRRRVPRSPSHTEPESTPVISPPATISVPEPVATPLPVPPSSEVPPASAPATSTSTRPSSGWRLAVTREIRRMAAEQGRMADEQRRMAEEQRRMVREQQHTRQLLGHMLRALDTIMEHFDLMVPGSAASLRPSPPRDPPAPPPAAAVAAPTPAVPDPEGSDDSLDRMLADDGDDTTFP